MREAALVLVCVSEVMRMALCAVVLLVVPCSFAHPLERWRAQCLPLLLFLGGNAARGGEAFALFLVCSVHTPSLLPPPRLLLECFTASRLAVASRGRGGGREALWLACSGHLVGCCLLRLCGGECVCAYVCSGVLSACGAAGDGSDV